MPLFLLALTLAGADCPSRWSPEVAAQWELPREDWAKRCADGIPAETILAEAQRAFIERCLAGVPALDRDTARAYCAQGVRGRDLLPHVHGAGCGHRSEAVVAAVGGRVQAALEGGDVAALYGERTGQAGSVVAPPGPGGQQQQGAAAQPAPKKGFKERAIPEPPYEPTDPVRGPHLKILDKRIMHQGVSAEAVSYLRGLKREMLENLDPATLKGLVDNKVHVVIIPRHKKLTDVPPFTQLKGKKTFDGRKWETVRGVANVPMDGGQGFATAIPEENLVGAAKYAGGYPKGHVFLHEYGHMIHMQGLPKTRPEPSGIMETLTRKLMGDPPILGEVEAAYKESLKRKEKTGLGAYADSSVYEFFAEGASMYQGKGPGLQRQAFLRKANRKLYDILRRIYGPPGRFRSR